MTATREPLVRREFGPSLFELLGPRARRRPGLARAAAALAALGVVLLAAWVLLGGGGGAGDGRRSLVVAQPVAFNLAYDRDLARVAPIGGEALRLQSQPGVAAPVRFAVTPLRLPRYRGDVSATLTLMTATLIQRMRATIPGFVWRGDGRINVNRQPGYQILYQARRGGHTVYGKRVLLVQYYDPPPRTGLDITMEAARSGAVPSVDAVGLNGSLKLSFRSVRLGTERP